MTLPVAIAISILLGVGLSFIFSYILKLLMKNKMALPIKIRVDSIEHIEKLVKRAKNNNITSDEKNMLWSEIMNYVMTTNSEIRAKRSLQEIKLVLTKHPLDNDLFEASEKVLNERFNPGHKASPLKCNNA